MRLILLCEAGLLLFEDPVSLDATTLLAGLRDAGVSALEIEGRQRGRAYVESVVRYCRQALAALQSGREDPGNTRMPYAQRTAFLLGGGKAMVNALYAAAAQLGVAVCYESELVGLDCADSRQCSANIMRSGKIERIVVKAVVICAGGGQRSPVKPGR